MKRKPTTYATVECMVADIRRGSQDSGVRFLSRVIRAVRRERADEVRRLRAVLREVRDELAWAETLNAAQVYAMWDRTRAALARRRRRP